MLTTLPLEPQAQRSAFPWASEPDLGDHGEGCRRLDTVDQGEIDAK